MILTRSSAVAGRFPFSSGRQRTAAPYCLASFRIFSSASSSAALTEFDQRAAGIYLKGSFYDDRIRAVDGERDGAEHGKLGYGSFHGGGLVDSGDTHIYIKNVSAGGHFSKPFLFNGDEASLLNIFPECLSSCRIDSFANLDGSVIITDIDDACAAGKCSKGLYLWRRDSWFVFKFLD